MRVRGSAATLLSVIPSCLSRMGVVPTESCKHALKSPWRLYEKVGRITGIIDPPMMSNCPMTMHETPRMQRQPTIGLMFGANRLVPVLIAKFCTELQTEASRGMVAPVPIQVVWQSITSDHFQRVDQGQLGRLMLRRSFFPGRRTCRAATPTCVQQCVSQPTPPCPTRRTSVPPGRGVRAYFAMRLFVLLHCSRSSIKLPGRSG